MKGIPESITNEIIFAAISSGKSLVSRTHLELTIETSPEKFPNIIRQDTKQRRKWISLAMNKKFSRACGNAWIVEVQHGTV